jgi:hypothetical protein
MPIDDQIGCAITGGLAFLAGNQLDSGELPVVTCERRDMQGALTPDPSVFPTALVAHSLGFVPGAEDLVGRAIDFLRGQRDEYGLWRHWTRDNPMFRPLPPDLDDTCCVSAVLAQHKVPDTVDPALVIANRDHRGLFYTWVVPRLRWTAPALRRVMLRQLRHLLVIRGFFRITSAEPGDVDAVVNANCLFALGAFPGHRAVVDYLLDILRDGCETTCDKWYDNPFVVRYAFSRSLRPVAPEAEDIIMPRLLSAKPANALERALLVSSMLDWGRR